MSFTPRIYCNQHIKLTALVGLSAEHCKYLMRVLRMKDGSIVNIFNENGEFECIVEGSTKSTCTLRVICKIREPVESKNSAKLSLAFAPTKGLGASFIVQKACELGVHKIYPIITKRSVVRSINVQKLQKIAVEAAEQSERLTIPKVYEIQPYLTFLENTEATNEQMVLCYERASEKNLHALSKKHNVIIIVGPEGGFEESEYNAFLKLQNSAGNIFTSKLNNNILKAETAAVAAIAVVGYILLK